MIYRTLLCVLISVMAASAFADQAEENKAATASAAESQAKKDATAAVEPEPGVVITTDGLVERCILPVVITEVDGEAIEEDAGRYEFMSGAHTFSGYSQGDFSVCKTIADAGLGADSPIGEGTITVTVPNGKEYFLGLDVRKADPKTWKIVTWRINH